MKTYGILAAGIFVVVLASAGFGQAPEPGKQFFVDLGEGGKLDMIWIPAGEFVLGAKSSGLKSALIANGFWMSRTEVTVGQWGAFAKTGYRTEAEKDGSAYTFHWEHIDWMNIKGKSWKDPGYEFPIKPDLPVTCVTWNDVNAFCSWINRRETERVPSGYVYRLPTELEWEYACRAGSNTTYWWGEDPADGKGRENLCSDDPLGHTIPNEAWPDRFPFSDGYAWASPVGVFGQKGRNAFGLSDMLGNAREWCLDSYLAAGPSDPVFLGESDFKVLRGGDFACSPKKAECAHRTRDYPTARASFYGFRLALGVAR